MLSLKGRRALITGASRGAGFGIAKAFAAAGAEVVVTARNEQRLQTLRLEIETTGGKVTVVPGDLATRAGAREVARRCGEVDILINNAALATGKSHSLLAQDDELWDREFALNVIAPVTLIQSLVPGMVQRGHGVVINISSIAAQRPNPRNVPYGASKAALEVASRAVAIELAPKGVRVNALALGLTDTEALHEGLVGGITVEQVGRMFVPTGRVTKVSEVAALCLFLADDAAAAITGTVITIDGGITAGTFDRAVSGALEFRSAATPGSKT
jgi:gluconate 5-dehydrogenase